MRKLILTLTLTVLLSLPAFSSSVSGFERKFNSFAAEKSFDEPIELWREYILVGEQWYLVIHYDDGSIGVWPVAQPPLN